MLVMGRINQPRLGSLVWSDTHLNYVIDIALTAEFSLAGGGAS